MKAHLKTKGIEIGATATRRTTLETFNVIAINAEGVSLQAEDGETSKVKIGALCSEYNITRNVQTDTYNCSKCQ